MDDVVIVSAVRTPIGKLGGQLASFSAVELGTMVATAAIKQAGLEASAIDQTIFGNVLQAGSGQNVARQISIHAGVPEASPAMTINEVCGSGLKSIRLGQAAILMGDADIVLVGGTESMSNAPYLASGMRFGTKFGDSTFVDSMEHDGLTDTFSGEPMGVTAENVAKQWHVSREAQDAFALTSHQKATAATNAGVFKDEIVPVTVTNKKGTTIITQDETIRPDTSLEQLSHLRPSFKNDGTVTAGNSAPLNDGASALVLMRRTKADELGLTPLATISAYAEVGIDPQIMGYSPVKAINQLIAKTQQTITDINRFELNEAFAAPSIIVANELLVPEDRLNPTGGSLAIGHPIGASGARIVTTLVHGLQRDNLQNGIASMCIGGGLGIAMELTRD
ncbi:acetyl-CoA C-acetyltransferase [Furfurilactobacillus siliginis]|uniref:acetyl-CoA C-acetyltransferase n=1 Tax=Furfurilactobacillus siliginis TaxID=348151 RepID=A0A0R2KWZ7_9LACO|nr:acetyl-CoA C-acetyltransferase [Furfurilactobacillus siliginis]KRN93982.1 acetyl-CoA acetyltransferase [Furfurilactobacillus siliginis]GEK29226.1 acetyl-CoA acetyltransferase [Furfurilactobacillus siliginis]